MRARPETKFPELTPSHTLAHVKEQPREREVTIRSGFSQQINAFRCRDHSNCERNFASLD